MGRTTLINWEGLNAQMKDMAAGIAHVQVETRVSEGDPARTIVDTARQVAPVIIVIGNHGRTGLSRLLMGSVAEYVVRHAPCPVLTVKNPSCYAP